MIRAAIVGFGHWGPRLARNLAIPGRCEVAMVCDLDPARLAAATRLHPGAALAVRFEEAVAAPRVDAVVVATPHACHFPIALAALRAGRHVLVCKPMTASSDEARRLIDEAARRDLVLLVDHTFVYSGAVRRLGALFRSGDLGTLLAWDSVRANGGVARPDTGVLWDLAIHDLSIFDHVAGIRPEAVAAASPSDGAAALALHLPGGAAARILVDWFGSARLRRTLVTGSLGQVAYDALAAHQLRLDGEPLLNGSEPEPLAVEAGHFLDCIEAKAEPLTGGPMALRLTEWLEAAARSMRRRGEPVLL
jgi:predicted dehydrogenase